MSTTKKSGRGRMRLAVLAAAFATGLVGMFASPAQAVETAVWYASLPAGGVNHCAATSVSTAHLFALNCESIQSVSGGQISRAYTLIQNYDSVTRSIGMQGQQLYQGSTQLVVAQCAYKNIAGGATQYCVGPWKATSSSQYKRTVGGVVSMTTGSTANPPSMASPGYKS